MSSPFLPVWPVSRINLIQYMKSIFLKCIQALFALTVFVPIANAANHPYLYTDKAGFKALAGSRDETVAELRSIVLEEADKAVQASVADIRLASGPNVTTNLAVIRSVQGKILNLSAAYGITGDRKYSTAAKNLIGLVCSWEDWGTAHFLDVGETAFALGVAYDWLYSVLTRQERGMIEQALVDKAFQPSFLCEGRDTWVKGDFNWNQVCHGGMAVAALAIYDSNPEICGRIIDRSAECVPYAAAVYAPDGAFPEGPSYWEYGTSYQVLMMEAMRSALGHCYGLDESPGFMKTADFRLQVCGNTGLEYGYSDYHPSFFNEPVMMWFGKELGRYDLQASELSKIRKVRASGGTLSRQTVFDLIWWGSFEPVDADAKSGIECWFAEGRMPLAVMRTDRLHNDAYAAFKGGTPDHSHGHMDSGSFIYESQGVRWALDLGTEVYDSMRAAGLDLWNYNPESTRWTTFRPSSDSHNLLRINGAPIVSTAVASDMSFFTGPEYCSATLDTTPLYANAPVQSVKRTVGMASDGNFSITDEVTASGDVVLSFQWITDAAAEVSGSSVRLTKSGKTILLTSPESDFIRVEDVSSVPGIQNSPNPGVSRILFVKKVWRGGVIRQEVKVQNGF